MVPKVYVSLPSLPLCRICLSADSPAALLSPCHCTGSVRYAHMACLLRWCVERASTRCEICGATYSAEVLPLLEAEVKAQRQAMQVGDGRLGGQGGQLVLREQGQVCWVGEGRAALCMHLSKDIHRG